MTTIHLDKAKATALARNLARHMKAAHGLDLRHAKSMEAVAGTLGWNSVQAMTAALKSAQAAAAQSDPIAPRTLWAVAITEEDAQHLGVFTSRGEAVRYLAGYVLAQWHYRSDLREITQRPAELDAEELIETFFDAATRSSYVLLSTTAADTVEDHDADDPVDDEAAREAGWRFDPDARRIRAVPSGIDLRTIFRDDADAEAYVRRLAELGEPDALRAVRQLDDRPASGTPRYVATSRGAPGESGLWEHLFRVDGPADTCRFVLDRVKHVLLRCEIQDAAGAFRPASRSECEDLLDSLLHGNPDLIEDPESYGLEVRSQVPGWARSQTAIRS